MTWQDTEIEALEFELLLEAIYRRYGYDFRHYSRAALLRRVRHAMECLPVENLSELQSKLLREPAFFTEVLTRFTVPVTQMFRDPVLYQKLREDVFPFLQTYSDIRIWHPGCATGEEIYSLAILMEEYGLLERSIIYGTDINPEALRRSKEGILTLENMQEASTRYFEAGGQRSLSDYYVTGYGGAALDARLRNHIVFSDHNLATDSAFGQMNLIVCRNTLIYFDKDLQERCIELFRESLMPGGFLCLGMKESLFGREGAKYFAPLAQRERIYRRRLE